MARKVSRSIVYLYNCNEQNLIVHTTRILTVKIDDKCPSAHCRPGPNSISIWSNSPPAPRYIPRSPLLVSHPILPIFLFLLRRLFGLCRFLQRVYYRPIVVQAKSLPCRLPRLRAIQKLLRLLGQHLSPGLGCLLACVRVLSVLVFVLKLLGFVESVLLPSVSQMYQLASLFIPRLYHPTKRTA